MHHHPDPNLITVENISISLGGGAGTELPKALLIVCGVCTIIGESCREDKMTRPVLEGIFRSRPVLARLCAVLTDE